MIHTVFHNYKDDELVRYALSAIHHPAVQEICLRVSNMSTEIDEIADLVSVEKELEEANTLITELRDEIENLHEEIDSLNCELEESHAV